MGTMTAIGARPRTGANPLRVCWRRVEGYMRGLLSFVVTVVAVGCTVEKREEPRTRVTRDAVLVDAAIARVPALSARFAKRHAWSLEGTSARTADGTLQVVATGHTFDVRFGDVASVSLTADDLDGPIDLGDRHLAVRGRKTRAIGLASDDA